MTSGPRRPCRALRQQRLYHWGDGLTDSAFATLKAESVGKTGWRCSASRDPQGGAGEKDVLETVVTRHKLH